ncbi:glycosyltransferase [Geofilum rubicundum]|uniref:Glycosyl transferase group 1 n=1 Tax=Geofilum rubicundum JCM 15548 TaxID=1236989 RepID=A0A0E9M277_9BACT|nr:glycosyltransferase [Geofilum rubicundum]GAO31481.1 glycosyl transferase group 1 [Geofilum rubicundum JCM 15548]
MKKIAWITADYFIDCDIDLIPRLNDYFDIRWCVVLPQKNSRYSEKELLEHKSRYIAKFFTIKYRFRDVKMIPFYISLIRYIIKCKPDLIYFNLQGYPYLAFLLSILLKKSQVILAVHQAEVHSGMKYKYLTKKYFDFLYGHFLNFHLFSKSQTDLFLKKWSGKNVFQIPLGLKDYGVSNAKPDQKKVVFLNFGNIIKSKNISLLIKAACNVYEYGYRNFSVKIYGSCKEWNSYSDLITYPGIFDVKIDLIPNEDIASLFCSSHYLVLPYSDVSQSGPLKIAFNYNIPVIASNLKEFQNEILNERTGFIFNNGELKDLERIMIYVIENHGTIYSVLKKNQRDDVRSRYSFQKIEKDYVRMFEDVVKLNKL